MEVFAGVTVDEHEIEERFVRAVGTAGQNRRHRATAVELRLNLHAVTLPLEVRQRLSELGGKHVTREGVLLIVSRKYRSQARNRAAARGTLHALLQKAFEPPTLSDLQGHEK